MERWLITYADMITLLLALFIIMYAVSTVDLAKFEAVAKSIREGFGATTTGGAVPVFEKGAEAPFSGGSVRDSSPFEVFAYQRIRKVQEAVAEELKKMGGKIELKFTERGIEINIFPSQILFDTASAALKPEFQKILRRLGEELVKLPNNILIEGHTDSRPISTPAFPSNWELSAARAASVQRFLIKSVNYDPSKIQAIGYADTRPAAPNDTYENMQKNRRVTIVILRGNAENVTAPATDTYKYNEQIPGEPAGNAPQPGQTAGEG